MSGFNDAALVKPTRMVPRSPCRDPACGRARAIGLAKGRLGVRQERFASRGEGHAARSPGKQRDTNFLFQLPDLLTQGRLGDPQHFRRTREMALSGDGQEIAQGAAAP